MLVSRCDTEDSFVLKSPCRVLRGHRRVVFAQIDPEVLLQLAADHYTHLTHPVFRVHKGQDRIGLDEFERCEWDLQIFDEQVLGAQLLSIFVAPLSLHSAPLSEELIVSFYHLRVRDHETLVVC